MPLLREADATAVVVKCPVAPSLITPAWLFRHDIVDEQQYAASTSDVLAPGLTSQCTLDWLVVTVTPGSLQLSTDRPEENSPLRDVTIAVLRALGEMPVQALGINRSTHFSVGGREGADRVGDALTPKDVWGGVLHLPGMLTLTTTAPREGLAAGRVNVRTEPSTLVPDGVFVEVNDHFDLFDLPAAITARDQEVSPLPELSPLEGYDLGMRKRTVALTLLEEEWNAADRRASAIFARLYSLSGNAP